MTHSIVATIKVKDGKAADFEAVALKLVAAVAANEPGCLLYRPHRSTADPEVFVFYEVYRDAAAFVFLIALRRRGGPERRPAHPSP